MLRNEYRMICTKLHNCHAWRYKSYLALNDKLMNAAKFSQLVNISKKFHEICSQFRELFRQQTDTWQK